MWVLDDPVCLIQGIPAEYRPRVWVVISGAAERRAAHAPNHYETMVGRLPVLKRLGADSGPFDVLTHALLSICRWNWACAHRATCLKSSWCAA